jgi:hypothetical protein
LIETPLLASGGKPLYAAVVFAIAVVLCHSFQYKDFLLVVDLPKHKILYTYLQSKSYQTMSFVDSPWF